MNPALFIGVYPCGLLYCDRTRERDGEWARLAFLPFATLVLESESDCPGELLAEIIK